MRFKKSQLLLHRHHPSSLYLYASKRELMLQSDYYEPGLQHRSEALQLLCMAAESFLDCELLTERAPAWSRMQLLQYAEWRRDVTPEQCGSAPLLRA
ncbi:hypothetical protein [Mumia zhuanghuii]|uniref:Uncharacterized protein n=1 Tax=Mumia zhuanghuii TaxID=2585211 RepID=A0A5C4MC61_9ACTN|nr:hypothetical protein [Mumia zhuanghuii]TNC35590.1 hypothetical protein FHE65_26955 [Mumia zhuanghuii]